ncbi:MAG: elongation factor P maturation arginine rhamnosyltransferase EarP [Formosimonas sp.]
MQRWDIFCTVIDNFGDAGVCWRLARQLVGEYAQKVRLYIDDINALAQIWPDVQPDAARQTVAGVEVVRWDAQTDWRTDATVVIEAFACPLPAAYAQQMNPQFWFNLEYLTAEPWAGECHNLNSPRAGGRHKIFFFPGFTEQTGGLLRERDLGARRAALDAPQTWARLTGFAPDAAAFKISLFAYERAPVAQWLACLMNETQPVQLAVTHGQAAQAVRRAGFVDGQYGALQIRFLPMLTQTDYDELLWSSDFNCVRGEDSWVRALWAGVPFAWHIYAQDDGAHWDKLAAFAQLYALNAAPWRDWQLFWNGESSLDVAQTWLELRQNWPQVREHAAAQSEYWAQFDGLAQQLMRRCGFLA